MDTKDEESIKETMRRAMDALQELSEPSEEQMDPAEGERVPIIATVIEDLWNFVRPGYHVLLPTSADKVPSGLVDTFAKRLPKMIPAYNKSPRDMLVGSESGVVLFPTRALHEEPPNPDYIVQKIQELGDWSREGIFKPGTKIVIPKEEFGIRRSLADQPKIRDAINEHLGNHDIILVDRPKDSEEVAHELNKLGGTEQSRPATKPIPNVASTLNAQEWTRGENSFVYGVCVGFAIATFLGIALIHGLAFAIFAALLLAIPVSIGISVQKWLDRRR